MSRMSSMKIYEKSVEKASSMSCPDCGMQGSLKYADETVLVCKSCHYSIEAEDLQSEWQEKIENEEGFYD